VFGVAFAVVVVIGIVEIGRIVGRIVVRIDT
jgi:hypothetical protein